MTSKKLINTAETAVSDCLRGLAALNPDVSLLEGHENVTLRSDLGPGCDLQGKVALVCGGGAGHEPSQAGFVCRGMLAAAVSGAVFASPPMSSVLACLRAVWSSAKPSGILVVVTNYTGDRINFGLALERAKAEGIKCEMVVVADDCALASKDRSTGRRGLVGTVLVHKIGGAMADAGSSLEEIVGFLRKVLPLMGTIGLGLGPCCPPGSRPLFQLDGDQAELGLGIHGEAGTQKIRLSSARRCVRAMLDHMTDAELQTKLDLPAAGSDVVVLVNNLGGTSNLELGVVVKEVLEQLGERKQRVRRAYAGSFMTSLEMAGVSVTVLRCDSADNATSKILACLDHPVSCIHWPRVPDRVESFSGTPATIRIPEVGRRVAPEEAAEEGGKFSDREQRISDDAILRACQALKSGEAVLNRFDTGSGDGDCGTTLSRGADGLLAGLSPGGGGGGLTSAAAVFADASRVAEEEMGGSAGAVCSILFAATSAAVGKRDSGSSLPMAIFQGLQEGCKAMML